MDTIRMFQERGDPTVQSETIGVVRKRRLLLKHASWADEMYQVDPLKVIIVGCGLGVYSIHKGFRYRII